MDVDEIITALLVTAPEKQFTIIVVGSDETEPAPDAEELLEPDDQDNVTEEGDEFMQAFYDAIFGGELKQVAGGGGGGSGSSLDAIVQGTLTP